MRITYFVGVQRAGSRYGNRDIDAAESARMVADIRRYLVTTYGGVTCIAGAGSWKDGEDIVEEECRLFIVESDMDEADTANHAQAIASIACQDCVVVSVQESTVSFVSPVRLKLA